MKHNSSFIQLGTRDRAKSLLDTGTFRELADPFDDITSPWQEPQGIVSQADDGIIVAKGSIASKPAVIIAIERRFQGSSIGEASGAKMIAALELAAEDNKRDIPTQVVLLLETGDARLQEAAIVELRQYVPVVGIIAGTVGCFGGMSITAALCSYLIVTREAQLGLNSPQVIGQEAGTDEYDSHDKSLIWSLTGGEARFRNGFVDKLVDDSAADIKAALEDCINRGKPEHLRSEQYDDYLTRLNHFDTRKQADAELTTALFAREPKS